MSSFSHLWTCWRILQQQKKKKCWRRTKVSFEVLSKYKSVYESLTRILIIVSLSLSLSLSITTHSVIANYQMTVSRFSATFFHWMIRGGSNPWQKPETHRYSHGQKPISNLMSVTPPKPVGGPPFREPPPWNPLRQSKQPVSFFWFYQSQPRNPQTVSVPKTHRPRRQAFICQFGCLWCSAQVSEVRDWV